MTAGKQPSKARSTAIQRRQVLKAAGTGALASGVLACTSNIRREPAAFVLSLTMSS